MNTIETDVLIVGGGPAGTSTALSLLNYSDLSVALIEQSDLSGHRIGENVSASIFDLLKYLRIEEKNWKADWISPTHTSVSLWGGDRPVTVDSILASARTSYQIDRDVLDFNLLKTVAERSGKIFPRTRYTHISRTSDSTWRVELHHSTKGRFNINSKFLVDATGRKASLCRYLNVPIEKLDNLMGVGVFAREVGGRYTPKIQCIEAMEMGWWYTSHLPDKRKVIIFFSDADIISRNQFHNLELWNSQLSRTQEVKKWCTLSNIPRNVTPWVKDASSHITNTLRENRFIAVGDAACSFDPISSMGIGFGMSSAFHAANYIISYLSENIGNEKSSYQKNITKHYRQYLELRDEFYTKEKRWANSLFWNRRNR